MTIYITRYGVGRFNVRSMELLYIYTSYIQSICSPFYSNMDISDSYGCLYGVLYET